MVRFTKTGLHLQPVTGELPEFLCIRCRKVKDNLTREDLPADEDCKEIL